MKPGDHVLIKNTNWKGKVTEVKHEGIVVEFPFNFTIDFLSIDGRSWNTLVLTSDELEVIR